MDEIILTKQYAKNAVPKIDKSEVFRYAGQQGEADDKLQKRLEELIQKLEVSYKVCFLRVEELPFEHESADLKALLEEGNAVYLFAATLGTSIDRQIAKLQKTSQTDALLLDALGTERIEALCTKFVMDMQSNEISRGNTLTKRFSPGYGDFPLEMQKEMFKALDIGKRIGVSLSDTFLMSPSKSVTAIMGVQKAQAKMDMEKFCSHKCDKCQNEKCQFRK